jgi:hypothetical protein
MSNFDKLYAELKANIGEESITPMNIVSIVVTLMKIVERFEDLPGVQKKQLILDTLVKYVKDELDGVAENIVVRIIELTVPTLIDAFISVDKKKVTIKVQDAKVDPLNIELKDVKIAEPTKSCFCF